MLCSAFIELRNAKAGEPRFWRRKALAAAVLKPSLSSRPEGKKV
jgi:hypothetical protein